MARHVSHQQSYHERDHDGPQTDTTWGVRFSRRPKARILDSKIEARNSRVGARDLGFVERAQRKRVDVAEAFIGHGCAAET